MRAFKDPVELRRFLPKRELFQDLKAVLGEGDDDPDIVVISYHPNGWDLQAGRPLLGKPGIPIRRHLIQQGIKFYATHVFPFANGQDKPKADEIRQAAPIIAEELRRLNAKKILLLGADAARFCPGFDYPFKKFTDIVNRTFTIGDTTYRVAHAPAAISSNPQVYSQFLDSVEALVNPAPPPLVSTLFREEYRVITNALQARALLKRVPQGAWLAVDLETTGLDPWTDRIITIQVSWEEGTGYAFPWDILPPEEWAGFLSARRLIFQNATFDIKFLALNGVFVQAAEDTMLMHSLIDETPGSHSMEILARKYLNAEKWGDTIDYDDMEGNSLQALGRYGARDTDITLRLANHFRPKVSDRHIYRVLHRAQNAITRSELRGIKIDREKGLQFQEEIERALHDRKEYLADTYGLENANSPKQVAELLVGKMGIPLPKVRGKVTTSSPVIEPFSEQHPVIRDILEYRHLTKAGSTYVANILAFSERDGRYHPEFKLAATETGRVAERLIMLIPRADSLKNPDLGKQYQVRLRELFIPDEGYLMIGADFRGLEVGMAAALTLDPQLIDDYNTRLDTHSVVAIQAFGLDIPEEPRETLKERVTEKHAYERELAKRGTFTWLYGGTEAALRDQLNITRDKAESILNALRTRYQGVAMWQEAIRTSVQMNGSVSTMWGRTRRFLIHPGLDQKLIDDQLREAINAPNQGMSSDVNLAAFAELESRGIQTLFPLHDAVYVQAPEDQAASVASTVKSVMENTLRSPVQFEAAVKSGRNWGALG